MCNHREKGGNTNTLCRICSLRWVLLTCLIRLHKDWPRRFVLLKNIEFGGIICHRGQKKLIFLWKLIGMKHYEITSRNLANGSWYICVHITYLTRELVTADNKSLRRWPSGKPITAHHIDTFIDDMYVFSVYMHIQHTSSNTSGTCTYRFGCERFFCPNLQLLILQGRFRSRFLIFDLPNWLNSHNPRWQIFIIVDCWNYHLTSHKGIQHLGKIWDDEDVRYDGMTVCLSVSDIKMEPVLHCCK